MGRGMVSRGLWGVVLVLLLASCDAGAEPDPCEGVDCGPCGVCAAEGDHAACFCAPDCVADGLDCVPEAGDGDGDGDGDADEDAPELCAGDRDCGDGLFCNGEERCDPGSDEADELGCAPGEPPDCDDGLEGTTDSCSEELGYVACEPESPGMLGRDCDDEDERAFPGQTEYFDWPARLGASGFDFNCNTIEEVEDTTTGWCAPTFSLTCELMPSGGGWAGTNPVVCGVRRYYVTGCPASLPCDPDSWTYVDIRPMCH